MAICLSTLAMAQELVNDSTMIYGKISSDEWTGNPLTEGCNNKGSIVYRVGETVYIIGTETCYAFGNKSATPKHFYLVLKETGSVYVPMASVNVLGGWQDKISKLSADDFLKVEKNTRDHFQAYFEQQERERKETQRVADSLETVRLNRKKELERIADSLETLRFQKLNAFLDKAALKGVSVFVNIPYDVSEYTEGTGMTFSFFNPTKKEIKYIYATVIGYNPVNDPIIENGKTSHTLKCVGPIAANDYGTYEFEYIWFTDMVETTKLTNLKVQYMDGTEKIIAKPSEVIVPRELIK